MKHLDLHIWLKRNGLRQFDLAAGIGMDEGYVSRKISRLGFTEEQKLRIVEWARKQRPSAKVKYGDLFSQEAA